MNLKKGWIAALAISLIGTAGATAYADSPIFRTAVDKMFVDTQIYEEGEMPDIPEDAVMLNKEIAEKNMFVDINTYAEDEMPAMPDNAVLLEKNIVEE